MGHAHRHVEAVFEQQLDGEIGPAQTIFSQQFYETDLRRGFARGYSLFVKRIQGPLYHAWGGEVRQPVPWGEEHHRAMRRLFPHVIGMTVLGEDLPDENNRVELDPDVKDSFGMPAARLVYTLAQNTVKMQEHMARMCRQAFEAAGAVRVLDNGPAPRGGHLMGTARMGNDPRRFVVNSWNQAHDVKNLFIVDGSSFTTCGAANPTSTIGALALRAADGIWKRRREWS